VVIAPIVADLVCSAHDNGGKICVSQPTLAAAEQQTRKRTTERAGVDGGRVGRGRGRRRGRR
jgi:hypothetical protein